MTDQITSGVGGGQEILKEDKPQRENHNDTSTDDRSKQVKMAINSSDKITRNGGTTN